MNKDILVEYGLPEKEAIVYLTALELGAATVNTIARRAKIFRTYCYDILESLSEKGLMSHVIKRGTKYYEAADPEKLVELLHEKEEKVNEILPQLKFTRASVTEKPTTEVYEGKEGIKTIHDDIIRTKKDTLVMGRADIIQEYLGPYFERYLRLRVKNKIKAKVVTEVSAFAKKIAKKDKKELRQTKMNPILNKTKTTVYIYGDKVAIMTYEKDVFGVIIKDKEIANSQRVLFEALWIISK
jgi:sugar-specific transcriptional regulator TrmB